MLVMVEYVPLALAVIAGIVWSIRLEGRVNLVDKTSALKVESLKELINARFDDSDQRLDRIERSLNGRLVKD